MFVCTAYSLFSCHKNAKVTLNLLPFRSSRSLKTYFQYIFCLFVAVEHRKLTLKNLIQNRNKFSNGFCIHFGLDTNEDS